MEIGGRFMTFGETLKNLRSEKDLSQEEISSYLGIEESVIEQWEEGIQQPDDETLARLAGYLEVTVAYLSGSPNLLDQLPTELKNFVMDPENHVWLEFALKLKRAGNKLGLLVKGKDPNDSSRLAVRPTLTAGLPPAAVPPLQVEIELLERNSLFGRYEIVATYINNSGYPVKNVRVTVFLKDRNETTILISCDTVLPGETSPKFKSFKHDIGGQENIEITKLVMEVEKEGETAWIEYDAKLGKCK